MYARRGLKNGCPYAGKGLKMECHCIATVKDGCILRVKTGTVTTYGKWVTEDLLIAGNWPKSS